MEEQEKTARYALVLDELRHMLGTEGVPPKYVLDDISRMAIVAAVLKMHLPHYFFVGFYRATDDQVLQIGPYQGEVLACGSIPYGRGVCGACARELRPMVVPDVSRFPGYIACDNQTRSEIVVPVIRDGKLLAVLDVDSVQLDDFDEVDVEYLERCIEVFC
jgi:GAF domain-containing protein